MMRCKWTAFTIKDIFSILPGRRLVVADTTPGNRPFIGALDNNNGVARFVDDENDSLDSNVLGVNYNGNGMVIGFYHPYECIFSDDVKRFHLRRGQDGRDTLLYAKVPILMQKSKFGYLYKFNAKRMEKTRIMLPADASGTPDWEYMSSFAKSMRGGLLMRYKQFVAERLSELESKDVPALDEIEWAPIKIVDFFDLQRGREANMASLADGDVPLISARNCDNGLKGFVCHPKRVVKGDVITLNNDGDGGAGLAYYQPMDMALDTHVTALVPKVEMSIFAQLFIARCLSGLHGFFGHGRSISNERARKIRVMLPVTEGSEPDFAYMEQYVKNLMLCKYEQYLSYLDSDTALDAQ